MRGGGDGDMQAGCGNGSLLAGDLVVRAKEASYTNDGSRPVQPFFLSRPGLHGAHWRRTLS